MKHYNECIEARLEARLGKEIVNKFFAFQDIGQMIREEREKSVKEQRKQGWMKGLKRDFIFGETGVELHIVFSKKFSSNQWVMAKLQDDGKIFIIAGDTFWQSPDVSTEEKFIPQFKKGKKIREFENIQALTNFLWD